MKKSLTLLAITVWMASTWASAALADAPGASSPSDQETYNALKVQHKSNIATAARLKQQIQDLKTGAKHCAESQASVSATKPTGPAPGGQSSEDTGTSTSAGATTYAPDAP